MRTIIAAESKNLQRPFEHLQPIVNFLLESGNPFVTGKAGFYLTQGGWTCDFRDQINYDLIQKNFELPMSIRFGAEENAILCDRSWIEIRGNVR